MEEALGGPSTDQSCFIQRREGMEMSHPLRFKVAELELTTPSSLGVLRNQNHPHVSNSQRGRDRPGFAI